MKHATISSSQKEALQLDIDNSITSLQSTKNALNPLSGNRAICDRNVSII